jgi:hypothetical protein
MRNNIWPLSFLILAYFAYLAQHDVLQFHPFTCRQHNFILLCGWVIFHYIYIYIYIHIYIYIYHIFLIHLSVVGYLGCFQNLTIVKSTTINRGVQVSLLYPGLHSLGISPGVVSLDHIAVLFLVFWGISILLSTVVALIYIPTNSG